MSRPSPRHFPAVAAKVLALALLGACQQSATPTAPSGSLAAGRVEALLPGGLAQTVTIEPASPGSGSEVTIRSVVVNRGTESVTLVSRICGLDYGGTLALTNPPAVLKCAAYSRQGALAPGDSVVTADLMRVSSPPGTYELRVRHALTPEAWVTLPVTALGS